MTRENKLALVVGFGLLLFVGILVSDHFSAAQRQDTAKISLTDRGRERSARPITIAAMPVASATMLQPEPKSAQASVVQATRGVTPIASQAGIFQPVVIGQPTVIATATPAKTATKSQESEVGVRLHPIAEGETMYSICKKEYGDGSLAESLAKFNKAAIPDPKRIRKGVTIRMPSAEVLRGGESKTRRAEASVKVAAPHSTPSVEVPVLAAADVIGGENRIPKGGVVNIELANTASRGSYTVRKGDTLATIAQRELGNKNRWQEIASLNASELPNPAALSPGTTLKIPLRR